LIAGDSVVELAVTVCNRDVVFHSAVFITDCVSH